MCVRLPITKVAQEAYKPTKKSILPPAIEAAHKIKVIAGINVQRAEETGNSKLVDMARRELVMATNRFFVVKKQTPEFDSTNIDNLYALAGIRAELNAAYGRGENIFCLA